MATTSTLSYSFTSDDDAAVCHTVAMLSWDAVCATPLNLHLLKRSSSMLVPCQLCANPDKRAFASGDK